MKYQINSIIPGSVLDEMGVTAGDFLLSINGFPVKDELDVRFFEDDLELAVEIEKPDGDIWELDIERDSDEIFGINYEEDQRIRRCTNNCIFCFIDQMPPGMRDTLYIKDDDERMSFLYGNYVTLTNLSESEKERIVRYHIMPINISVHTTNPELRKKMLHNRFAGNIMKDLRYFKDNNIAMNAQIVLCPGYNDGKELLRTLTDLAQFYPEMKSVSVVPIGLTRFRKGLPNISPVSPEKALETLDIILACQKDMLSRHNVHFVYPSDELYLIANREIPDAAYYEDFSQIENGVGMIADFENQLKFAIDRQIYMKASHEKRFYGIITGELTSPYVKRWCDQIMRAYSDIHFEVYTIVNNYFGKSITVSGLLTGTDMLCQVPINDKIDAYFLPENCVKHQTEMLLDDVTVTELSKHFNKPVRVIANDGRALLSEAVIGKTDFKTIEKQEYEPKSNAFL